MVISATAATLGSHFFCSRIVPTRTSSQCNTKTLKTTAINSFVPGHDCRARHTMRVGPFTHVPYVHQPQSVHSGHTNFPFQCGMCVETSSSVSLRVTRSSRSRSKPDAKASAHQIVRSQNAIRIALFKRNDVKTHLHRPGLQVFSQTANHGLNSCV